MSQVPLKFITGVGLANGLATLDVSGKVPASELPSTLLEYQGLWNPSTNTPTLQDSTGTNAFVYQVSVAFAGPIAGLASPTMVNFQVGNIVIYSSALGEWQQAASLTGVTSVNGAVGAVTVNAINQLTGDVTAGPASGSQSVVATLTAVTNSTITTLSALSLPGAQITGNISGNAANITATSNSTLTTLSALSLPGSQVTGNISGNAANISATSNSTLTTLSALSLPYSQLTGAPTPLVFADSLVNTAGTVTLVNDSATPGASKYYGTNASSVLGYFALPSPGTGTVTSFSFTNGGGFTGSVSNPTTTPTLSLTATLAGDVTGPLTATVLSATTNSTLTTLSALSLPGAQVTGNISGTASNITASSNATLTTLSALSLPGSQVTGNIAGNAANITATSNSTLTTLSALSLPYSQITGAPAAITALTGDGTATGPGSVAFTLATVNSNVGTFGSSSLVPVITVNGKGLITAVTTASVTASAAFNVVSKTTTYTAVANDYILASSASFTITLPTAVGISGQIIVIKHSGTSLSQLYTLNTTSAQTIGGIASGAYVLYTNGETLTLVSDGANWQIQDHKTETAPVAYTPTFNGFGTVTTSNMLWAREGSFMKIFGYFVAGTPTGITAGVTFPGGMTVSTILSSIGGSNLYIVGLAANSVAGAGAITVLTQGTNATVGFSLYGNGSFVPTQAALASSLFGSGTTITFQEVTIPIQGWQP